MRQPGLLIGTSVAYTWRAYPIKTFLSCVGFEQIEHILSSFMMMEAQIWKLFQPCKRLVCLEMCFLADMNSKQM